MSKERIITTLKYFPIVILVIELNIPILVDVLIALVAIRAIYEYSNCAKEKKINIVSWIGYFLAALLTVRSFVEIKSEYILYLILSVITILFAQVIITNGKTTFQDITYTVMGIIYIIGFLSFIPLIYSMKNGKLLLWYVFFIAWGTDTFAYITGKYLGKHKFSKISPNKTIEGCLGGVIGAIVVTMLYTLYLNLHYYLDFNYLLIATATIVLSLLSQIGDFSASVIKRYFEVKDFSDLFPGHGGMIDRIDSVIFIAPFAYFFIVNLL